MFKLLQERQEIIHALKEENDRLLGKIKCIEEPDKESEPETNADFTVDTNTTP